MVFMRDLNRISFEMWSCGCSHLWRQQTKQSQELRPDFITSFWQSHRNRDPNDLPKDDFFQHYRETVEPQLQIAHNQGFQADWSLS